MNGFGWLTDMADKFGRYGATQPTGDCRTRNPGARASEMTG